MHTMVLCGLETGQPLSKHITRTVRKCIPEQEETAWFDLPSMNINYCNGCGYCGDVKPGLCAKKDDMQQIYPHLARASRIVFISPIRFGGYGGHMKKAIDRFSPMGLGTYRLYKGELHHHARYGATTSVLSIGILPQPDAAQEQTFLLASSRIAACLFGDTAATTVVNGGMDQAAIGETITDIFKRQG